MQPYLWNTFLPHLFPFHCLRSDFKLLHVAPCNLRIPVTSTTKLWVFLCSRETDIKVTYICLNKTKHLQFSFLRSAFSFDQLKHYLLVQDMHTYTATHDPEEMPTSLCTPSVHLHFVFTLVNQTLNWIHHLISHQVSNINSFELLLNSVRNQRVKNK